MYLLDYTTVVMFLSSWQWCSTCACSTNNVNHGPRIEEVGTFCSKCRHGLLVEPPPNLVHQRFQRNKLDNTHTPFSTDPVMRSSWPSDLLQLSIISSLNVEREPVSADPANEATTIAMSRQNRQEYSSSGVEHTMKMGETKRVSISSNTVTQYTSTMDEQLPEPASTSHPAVLKGSSKMPTSSTTSFQYTTQFESYSSSEYFQTKYQDPANEQPDLDDTRTSIRAIEAQDEQGYTSTTKRSPESEEESDRASKYTPDSPKNPMALAASSSGTTPEYFQDRSTGRILGITSQSIDTSQGPSSNSQEAMETGSGEPTSITLMAHSNTQFASDDNSRAISSSIKLPTVATTFQDNGLPVNESKTRTVTGLSGHTRADSAQTDGIDEQWKSFPTGLSLSITRSSNSQKGSGEKAAIDMKSQSATFGRPQSKTGLSTIINSGIWRLTTTESNSVTSTPSLNAPKTLSHLGTRIEKPSEASDHTVIEENRDPIDEASETHIPQEGTVPVSIGVVIPAVGISAILFEYIRRRNNRRRAIIRKRQLNQVPDPYKSHFSLDTL